VPEPLLEARDLSKRYATPRRTVEVLRSCSLALDEGESVSVLGASGSGKSTLLHLLGTLEMPDGGGLRYRGRDLLAAGSRARSEFRRRELGFIFQFHHLLPEFSAVENVALPALIGGRPRREAFDGAGALLERVDLAGRREHRPAELSGGEQQRVAVARALLTRPRLILADEPTGNLDRSTGAEVADLLLHLCAEAGTGLVLVTHDRDLAARCDRCLHLVDGRLAMA